MQHSFRYASWPPRVRTVSVSQGWSCAIPGTAWSSSALMRQETSPAIRRLSMADSIVGLERAITCQVVVRSGSQAHAERASEDRRSEYDGALHAAPQLCRRWHLDARGRIGG